jgi:hypothetical protein
MALKGKQNDIWKILIVLGCMALIVPIQKWIDNRRPPANPSIADDSLYLTPATARRVSMGFNGLASDWYWMRSLQYVGNKVMTYDGDIQLDNLSTLNLKTLSQYLDTTVTLDPQFMDAYEYAAVVLSSVDQQSAIRILKKGIEANPAAWKLRHHLGYIFWQTKRFDEASTIYDEGSRLPGAPNWMKIMAAQMKARGGERETARAMYTQMYQQSEDRQLKDLALMRLIELKSLDERDVMKATLGARQSQTGHCPASWREIAGVLAKAGLTVNSSGDPVDPMGYPYLLDITKCEPALHPDSKVIHPYRGQREGL